MMNQSRISTIFARLKRPNTLPKQPIKQLSNRPILSDQIKQIYFMRLCEFIIKIHECRKHNVDIKQLMDLSIYIWYYLCHNY